MSVFKAVPASSFLLRTGILALALTGCSKKDKEASAPVAAEPAPATPAEPEATPTEPAPSAAIDAAAAAPASENAELESFFNEFKAAALAKDRTRLEALSWIGEGSDLDADTFQMMVDTFLSKEVLETLSKTEASSLQATDEEGSQVWQFAWSESTMVDGEEMESALFFYFKKVDGKLKLFRVMAAG